MIGFINFKIWKIEWLFLKVELIEKVVRRDFGDLIYDFRDLFQFSNSCFDLESIFLIQLKNIPNSQLSRLFLQLLFLFDLRVFFSFEMYFVLFGVICLFFVLINLIKIKIKINLMKKGGLISFSEVCFKQKEIN